jgi:surface protein
MNIEINDKNIHNFVKSYINNFNQLPDNLQSLFIGEWDVSKVTDMNHLFANTNFNEPLNWDVRNVTDMTSMFAGCSEFDQPLNWDVGNVTDMTSMFAGCSKFNQSLEWNVTNVTEMSSMFKKCIKFNQSLEWNVTNVEDMMSMFEECSEFNQPLNWDVGNVTNMSSMFEKCSKFNQPLINWDVGNVTNMSSMFKDCEKFNEKLDFIGDIQVKNMSSMFENCLEFNQPLNWNVTKVTNLNQTFLNCIVFNQPLAHWIVSNVKDISETFLNCREFDQDLNGWDKDIKELDENNRFHTFIGSNININNVPLSLREITLLDRRNATIVDPNQIHKESSIIDYNKFNSYLKDRVIEFEGINGEYINQSLTEIIKDAEYSPTEKSNVTTGLGHIMTQRLGNLDYSTISPNTSSSVFYALEYVKKQPPPFKKMYIDSYVFDCVNAYEGDGVNADVSETMTCAAGALERIFMSLIPACASMLESNTNKKNEYEMIKSLLITSDPKKLIPLYILDWLKSHNIEKYPDSGLDKNEDKTGNGRKQQLKEYLQILFPHENQEVEELINQNIIDIDFNDNATFTYGGKRKTQKYKKGKNNATKHKRKGNKSVKSKNKNNKRSRKIRKIIKQEK